LTLRARAAGGKLGLDENASDLAETQPQTG